MTPRAARFSRHFQEMSEDEFAEFLRRIFDEALAARSRIDVEAHAADHAWLGDRRGEWDAISEYVLAAIERDRERAELLRELRRELAIKGLIGFALALAILLAIGAHEWVNDWLHRPGIPVSGK